MGKPWSQDSQPAISLLQRRRAQAELVARVYDVLQAEHGRQAALETIAAAVEADARAAGKAFAAQAPAGPCLAHFATVLEVLGAGGQGLELADVEQGGDRFTYRVTRCGYLEMYAAMGIDPELAYALSCGRDYAFAMGYHPRLKLERPRTLGRGDHDCLFNYVWADT